MGNYIDTKLGRRRVGERDTHLYWFVPTPAGAWRQAAALEEPEIARWRSLPAWFRERWYAYSIGAPKRSN